MRIGVCHLKTKMFIRRYSVEKLREIASKARGADTEILCLSPLMNVEDLVDNYSESRLRSVIRSYAEKIPSSITDPILDIAEENGLYVIAGGLLERAGPKLFVTSIVVSPLGRILAKYRKIAVSRKEIKAGISSGNKIVTFKVKGRRIGITQDHDIFVPEIFKSLRLQGVHVIFNLVKKNINTAKGMELLRSAAVVRAFETKSLMAVCGVTVERYSQSIYSTPTIIASPSGTLEIHDGSEEALIIKDLESFSNSEPEELSYTVPQKTMAKIYKSVVKTLKEI